MGPKITKVEKTSQATPLSNDFMRQLQGWLSNPSGTMAGPMQRTGVGSGTDQYMNSPAARIGGVNTAGSVADYTNKLIGSATANANLAQDRGAAQIREAFSGTGNRLSKSLATTEGQFRNESNMGLEQLIAQILTNQGAAEQGARQFDVQANQAALNPYLAAMQLGALPEEIIASPSVGSQILNGVIQGGAAYLTGGGSIPFLGGKNKAAPTTNYTPSSWSPPQWMQGANPNAAPFGTYSPGYSMPTTTYNYNGWMP